MKYCIFSTIGYAWRDKVDEIKFALSNLNQAIEYAKEHSDKRVIVEISTLDVGQRSPGKIKLRSIHKEIPNIHYSFTKLNELITYVRYLWEEDGNQEDRHYMFDQPVISWAMVMILRYYKVTDILIAEPLTFRMEDVYKGIKSEGIAVRVRPAESKHFYAIDTDDNAMNHFWLLPQAIKTYEKYIDVIDFSHEFGNGREEALCKLFINDKNYDNLLKYYLNNCEDDNNLPATMLDDKFFIRRLNCGQTCLISPNNCHYCSTFVTLHNALKTANSKEES